MASEVAPGDESTGTGVVKFKPLRLEQAKISDAQAADYRHAFLTDVSGKDGVFEKIDFSYAVFIRAYFHQAKFSECKFIGSRFADCNFRNALFFNCDFRYADFTGTRISTSQLLQNLPDEPNIRRELLQILRKNALSLGDVSSSRRFVLAEIDAKREHFRRAWRRDTTYYKNKYGGFWQRVVIGAQRVGFWLDSFLWGHGERLWKIAISAIVLLTSISALSTLYWGFHQTDPTVSDIYSRFSAEFGYYVNVFLGVQFERAVDKLLWLDWIVTVARYVVFGVLVAGLFRWFSHR